MHFTKHLHLLLASDGSDSALRAADWIKSHFPSDDVDVTIASVIRSIVEVGSPTFAPTADYAAPLEDVADRRARQACERTQEMLEPLASKAVVLEGQTIAGTLIAYVRDHQYDALVTGRRRHALFRAVLGSISAELSHQSPIPVWIIP